MQATWTSVKVAVLTIFVATPVGTMAAYGLVNSNSRLSKILFPIFISPMMVPIILVAIGLFTSLFNLNWLAVFLVWF